MQEYEITLSDEHREWTILVEAEDPDSATELAHILSSKPVQTVSVRIATISDAHRPLWEAHAFRKRDGSTPQKSFGEIYPFGVPCTKRIADCPNPLGPIPAWVRETWKGDKPYPSNRRSTWWIGEIPPIGYVSQP